MVRRSREIVPVPYMWGSQVTLLVGRALDDTPYLHGALDALVPAVKRPNMDGCAMASVVGDRIDGVVVFGFFGGANGAGRLQLTVVDTMLRRKHIGRQLVDVAIAQLSEQGARFVLAELPDDPRALPGAREFLESMAFREESRVESFYREGVALTFLRRELSD